MGVMPPGAVGRARGRVYPVPPVAVPGAVIVPPGAAGCRGAVAPWASISGTRGRVSPTIFGRFSPGAAGPRPVPGGRCRVGVSPHGINAACPVLESRRDV